MARTKSPSPGEYVRAWRKKRRLTQDELARILGMTGANLCLIEKGAVVTREVYDRLRAAGLPKEFERIWLRPIRRVKPRVSRAA